jgi:hypothetical protein
MLTVLADSSSGSGKSTCGLLASTFLALTVVLSSGAPPLGSADALPKVAKTNVSIPVTVTDTGSVWIIDNGIVRATIDKNTSNMPALIYHGMNTMGPGGFWEYAMVALKANQLMRLRHEPVNQAA